MSVAIVRRGQRSRPSGEETGDARVPKHESARRHRIEIAEPSG